MPNFLANGPRINLKVADTAITAPAPFTAGHALTEAEAKFLNRQVAGVVANPIPAFLRKEAEKADGVRITNAEELQHLFDMRYAEFELGASNRGSGEAATTDPVTKFARQIASTRLDALLTAKGKKIADVKKAKVPNADGTPSDQSVYSKLVSQLLAANPDIMDTARAQLAAMNEAASELNFDLGDLGSSDGASEQPTDSEPEA